MKDAILTLGDKIHALHRVDKETRRHFVREVEAWQDKLAPVTFYVFVVDNAATQTFVRRPDRRTKVIALNDGELVVNALPSVVQLEDVHYEVHDHHLHVATGECRKMDVKGFGWD